MNKCNIRVSFILTLILGLILSCRGNTLSDEKEKEEITDSTSVEDEQTSEVDQEDVLPKGWYKWGYMEGLYIVGIDDSISHSGEKSVFVKGKTDKVSKNIFGTVMQTCDAKPFIGKRVKLTAYVKTENVEEMAGMWLRIDSHQGNKGFENMDDRPIKGTTDWTLCTIVMDVPEMATTLNYGVRIDGPGTVWYDDFMLDIVGKSEPLTKPMPEETVEIPTNLGFEE